jgi:hypothetical protein
MVDLPGSGGKRKINKKAVMIAGAGVLVGGSIYFIYKRKNGTAPASADTSGTAYDPSAIDPNTGLPYGQDSGIDPTTGVPYADEFGGSSGFGGSGFGGWPVPITDPGTGGTTDTTTAISTKAEWATDVTTKLTGEGYSRNNVELAIGKYFLGQPLTDEQVKIIETAIGLDGQPPGGAPALKRAGGGGGTGQKGQVSVPNVVGKHYAQAAVIITSKGLKPRRGDKVVGVVKKQSPHAGARVKRGSVVTLSH